ncbi:MAG: hypothetical protein NTX50_14945 [Candidatus Sumerlaeota bacterium]|nr:hypothetical protein [Candidatus Sumerlaeota bacterium]
MTNGTHLQMLLTRRPIVLWVEDIVTKTYLERIWQPEETLFNICVAGGNDTVDAVVHDLRDQGYGYVFGLADRDFGNANVAQWMNPASSLEVFRPSCHEIENYLLDWDALAGCEENMNRYSRLVSAIESRVRQQAQTMVWWMACRTVLSRYRSRLIGDYPKHPKIPHVASLEQAEQHILTQRNWWCDLPTVASHIQIQGNVTMDLREEHNAHGAQLADGSWIREFAGKELFRSARGFLFETGNTAGEQMDVNLAQSVGEWQTANNKAPQELLSLKTALKNRVGI